MRRFLQIATLFALALLTGCRGDGAERVTRTSNIEVVFFDSVDRVTVLVRDNGSLVPKQFSALSVVYKDDAPAGQPMYLDYTERKEFGDYESWRIEVHVHNQNEIRPGAWDYGKFGHGQNTRVE